MEIYEITFLVATATCIVTAIMNLIHVFMTRKELKRAKMAMEILEQLEWDDDIVITYEMHGGEITRHITARTEK